jgi:DNA-binding winged helix-turn-helix (wHTH) protein
MLKLQKHKSGKSLSVDAPRSPALIRFGTFEGDLRNGELRKQGRKIKLQDRPFQFLIVLLENPGQVVSREELARKLWAGEVPEDVGNSLNIAVKKVRQALGDDADTPRFIETVPRRGYRFLGPVEAVSDFDPPAPSLPTEPVAARPSRQWIPALAVMLLLSVAAVRLLQPSHSPSAMRTVQLTHIGIVEPYASILTDGSRIYFHERAGGRFPLAQVSVEGGTPSPLAAPPGLPELRAISPDRTELLVNIDENNEAETPLLVIPTVSGSPRRLGNVRAHHATWSRDGRSVVYGFGKALYRIDSDGTGARKIADTPGEPYFIQWSPQGPDRLRFSTLEDTCSIWECLPDGSRLRRFEAATAATASASRGGMGAGWTPDGKYYLFETLGKTGLSVWQRARPGARSIFSSRVLFRFTPHRATWGW